MKKYFFIILTTTLFFLSAMPIYAYTINSDFIIDNQTDKNLVVYIKQPYSRYPIQNEIPAKKNVTIAVDNADYTGLLYQASVAPFKITESATGLEQVNGRIAFYVGSAVWSKYSFLDSVTS